MPDLYIIASSFRTAIEKAVRAGKLKEMITFPRGCCGLASELLQQYLFELNIFTWYISGRCGYGWDGESHAWLETKNGTVIDITGDQYQNKKLNFTIPVYIGPRTDGFHDKFELDKPIAFHYDNDPLGQKQRLSIRYETVMSYMMQER